MLACELAQAGLRPRLVDERVDTPNITRAFAVHARTLELLDGRGLADELVSRGVPVDEVTPAPGATLSLKRELASRFPMVLVVPQSGTENLLAERAGQLGVEIVRGAEVVGLRQDDEGVTVELAGGATVRTGYLVGCDGAHSTVRSLAGVDFVGKQYETHIVLADVRLVRPPGETLFGRTSSAGAVIVIPFGDGWFRAIAWDRLREQAPLNERVRVAEVRDAFTRIAGEDFGMTEMRWSSRFLSERKQARRYRVGRVLLAGDAAHVHSPLGGQGMNTGIGDAMNLGWKLASSVIGSAPPWLLDSYEQERHRVGAQVLELTDAFNQLVLGGNPVRRLLSRTAIRAIVRIPRTRRALAERLSQVGIAYPRGSGDHQMVGTRAPDVDCNGTRLYELLRAARFVLVTTDGVAVDRLGIVHAAHATHADERLPAALLVRPDGYVAWASQQPPNPADISAAVARWVVPPSPAAG
jgi:2-polyprenyl-6-methoxyphenol hydroxylase-like FAD-dependent oxidoreductase